MLGFRNCGLVIHRIHVAFRGGGDGGKPNWYVRWMTKLFGVCGLVVVRGGVYVSVFVLAMVITTR